MMCWSLQSACLFLLIAVSAPSVAVANLEFHYEGQFTESEQEKLEAWITEAETGLESLVGVYPFDVKIRFSRVWSDTPVPFASTTRGRSQGIHFRVDPRYSLEDFRQDWTAAHELSHLLLPFVGQEQAWFAEGFASYMQFQVMHAAGILSADDASNQYLARLKKAERDYDYPEERFVDTVPTLRAERNFPVMYWGGSVFFVRLNHSLSAEHGITLIELLSRYLSCCRRKSSTVDELMGRLDRLAGSKQGMDELYKFRTERGFPTLASQQLARAPFL
jgi:hypothetical protein